jgi:hypothetical protein
MSVRAVESSIERNNAAFGQESPVLEGYRPHCSTLEQSRTASSIPSNSRLDQKVIWTDPPKICELTAPTVHGTGQSIGREPRALLARNSHAFKLFHVEQFELSPYFTTVPESKTRFFDSGSACGSCHCQPGNRLRSTASSAPSHRRTWPTELSRGPAQFRKDL